MICLVGKGINMPVAFGRMDWNWFCHLATKLSVVIIISLWSENSSNFFLHSHFTTAFPIVKRSKRHGEPRGTLQCFCFPLFSPWPRAWLSFRQLIVVQLLGFRRNLNRFTIAQLNFLTLKWHKSYEFSRSYTSSFKFWCWAKICREPPAPHQTYDHEGKQQFSVL